MEMPEDGVWWLNYSQYEDLRLYEIGIQRCAPSYSFGPIIRDRYILHYVFEGEGVLRIDDKEFKVKSNSFFLLPPDVLVQYQADEKKPVYVPIEENSQLKDAVINLIMYKENEYACIGYMYILFDKMNRWTRHVEKKAGTNLRTMNYMREAIQYINTKYCESIMVQQIADHCGVDRAYLSKIFKYATGKTLQEYLIQFRIKRAKQLLKDTDLSVKYVSYSVGYNDPFTFSKVFKKQEGVSPSVWRKNHNNFA